MVRNYTEVTKKIHKKDTDSPDFLEMERLSLEIPTECDITTQPQEISPFLLVEVYTNQNNIKSLVHIQKINISTTKSVLITRLERAKGLRIEDNIVYIPSIVVSKMHMEILVYNSSIIMVQDLGSENGTFVRGRRLSYEKGSDNWCTIEDEIVVLGEGRETVCISLSIIGVSSNESLESEIMRLTIENKRLEGILSHIKNVKNQQEINHRSERERQPSSIMGLLRQHLSNYISFVL